MDREKMKSLMIEAAEMSYGEDNAFIGAYLLDPEEDLKCDVAEGGNLISLSYLLARVILCISTTHEVKPWKLFRAVGKVLRLMIKYHKGGTPIGEIETRELEDR